MLKPGNNGAAVVNLDAVADAYGLSVRQRALLDALVDTGGIRAAAVRLGISYVSARNIVAELKMKFGVVTIPMMVGLVVELTVQDSSLAAGAARHHDLYGLSDRQYAIARSIGVAKSRVEIAAALNVSPALVDAELKEIYLILGISRAGELVRVIADAQARHTALDSGAERAHDELERDLPVATLIRGGRRIGYSDFGPPGGRPVLILHSTITSRAPPSRLVTALRRRGFRPLAIDRPGFDATDPAGVKGDPYWQAAEDAASVCDALGLNAVDVIARGSGQAAMRLAQLHPSRVARVVMVNPTPAMAFTTVDRGPLGAVKRAFGRRPWAVAGMIRLLAAYATPGRMYDGMLRSFRESPPDLALVRDDPQFTVDYLRAVRSFARGRIAGYVAEQSAWASGMDVAPLRGMAHWRIVQGRHFVLHDPEQAMDYWRARLPETPIRWVDAAGQMLAYSHADEVVDALMS